MFLGGWYLWVSTKLDRWSFAEVCTLLNAILVLSVQTVFLILVFSHLVIIPILLMIIDQEKNSVHTLWIYEAILWRIQNTEYCALYAYVLRYSLNILKCHFKGIIQLYFKILTGLYIVRPLYTPQMITWISLCDTFNKDWYGADQTQPAWLGIHSLMWPASDLSELSFEGKSFFINGCFTGASVILPSARSTIQKDQPFSPVFN